MNKSKHFLGIDISSNVFDVVDHEDKHTQYSNDLPGFKKFGKTKVEAPLGSARPGPRSCY